MILPTHQTHEVKNQSVPYEGRNLFTTNRPLVEALKREGGEWALDRAVEVGRIAGDEAWGWGFQANENPPKLVTHDRFGNRADEVEFHPAWHSLMKMGVEQLLHALPWKEKRKGGHVARAAMFMTISQAEGGFLCPISMTYSVVPALKTQPELAEVWVPRFTSEKYDGRLRPASQKPGALAGMGMTEKQGGSDVRANSTVAKPVAEGGPGKEYLLTGHKWFCSAPMCDAFLVLAQAPKGLSCFLVPRFLPDGTKNVFRLQRLKDKLGNRSNASSEVEFDGTWAQLVGEEGRGVPTIIEMVNHTRLDCVLGSAALLRAGTAMAIHHASHRSAFGRKLIDQPLMKNVLADLAVESEAATLTAMRLARAYDDASVDPAQIAFRRLATAVSKYWICKRGPSHIYEALECFGGNGYVEASGMPRLYREAPLNSIWEDSGNVICLDVLRALAKEPSSLDAFLAEVDEGAKREPALQKFVDELKNEFVDLSTIEPRARRVVEGMALAFQGSLLVRFGDPDVASAFCASRLSGNWGNCFGSLEGGNFDKIIERSSPLS